MGRRQSDIEQQQPHRALLKGAKWVETNPKAAAIMAVEKKYLASTSELNTAALARLRYIPSVQMAEESVHTAAQGNESREDACLRKPIPKRWPNAHSCILTA